MTKQPLLTFPALTDEATLVLAAQRDPKEFTALYDRYFRPIYRYLYSRVGSVHDAEDLTAQTFLAALEALPRYHHRGYFSAWLFTIARNKARDHYHLGTQEAQLDENLPGKAEGPLSQAIRSDQIEQLASLISKLEEEEQELIHLRCIANLSFAEIGASLGRKENTVKKTYYRLVARLRRQLELSHD